MEGHKEILKFFLRGAISLFLCGKMPEIKDFLKKRKEKNICSGVVFLLQLYYNVVRSGIKWGEMENFYYIL